MPKEIHQLKITRGPIEISHGRATLQNANPPVTCPNCHHKLEIFTWHGGTLTEEINAPSYADPEHRYSYIFIPKVMRIEPAYSPTARPALTFRSPLSDKRLEEFLGDP